MLISAMSTVGRSTAWSALKWVYGPRAAVSEDGTRTLRAGEHHTEDSAAAKDDNVPVVTVRDNDRQRCRVRPGAGGDCDVTGGPYADAFSGPHAVTATSRRSGKHGRAQRPTIKASRSRALILPRVRRWRRPRER